LAFCTVEGKCGKPAADVFCRDNDFEAALSFQRDHMESHGAQIRFMRIKCWRSKGGSTVRQARASAVSDAGLISNVSTKSSRLRLGGQGDWK
jgi:hypothetical protein